MEIKRLHNLIEELARAADCAGGESPVVFDVSKKAIVISVKDDDPIHIYLDVNEPKPLLCGNFQLDEYCPDCQGIPRKDCGKCFGVGMIMTEHGNAITKLLSRYYIIGKFS